MPVEALLIAGGIAGGVSAIQQGKYAEQMGKYNLEVAQQEAESAKTASEYESRELRIEKRKALADQLVMAAKGGVVPSAGTPLKIRQRTGAEFEQEVGLTQYGYNLAGQQALSRGRMDYLYGKNQKRASRWQAGSSVLTGAGMALMYNQGR